MSELRIVDAMAEGRATDAAAIVFEYVAMTWEEAGLPRPVDVDDLPGTLAVECRTLPTYYAAPGAILLALGGFGADEQLAGCVGLAPLDGATIELKRLYVRAPHRRRGFASTLMRTAHAHAREHGFTRTVLTVMPTRGGAIAFYEGLGYVPIAPAYEQPYDVRWFGYEL